MAEVLVLKVTLTDWEAKVRGYPFRVLAMPGEMTLYDLAWAINQSFDFDFDHPFGSYDHLKDPYRAKERYELFADMDEEDFDDDEVLAEEALEVEQALEELEELVADLDPAEAKEALIAAALAGIPAEEQEEARAMLSDSLTLLEDELENEAGAEPRGVQSTLVKEVFNKTGKKMLYLFDYGDEWRFIVQLKGLEEAKAGAEYPLMLEAVGEAPEQYPEYEDDEDDEDFDDEDYDDDFDDEDVDEDTGAAGDDKGYGKN